MTILVSIIFLTLLGLAILQGRYVRAGIGEKPLFYSSILVEFILNVGLILFLILTVYLIFFYSWKLFLLLMLVGFFTEVFIIVPLIERVLHFLLTPLLKYEPKDL